jgi:hypothetical protein
VCQQILTKISVATTLFESIKTISLCQKILTKSSVATTLFE